MWFNDFHAITQNKGTNNKHKDIEEVRGENEQHCAAQPVLQAGVLVSTRNKLLILPGSMQ